MAHIFVTVLVYCQMYCPKTASSNLLLYHILVNAVDGPAIVIAAAIV